MALHNMLPDAQQRAEEMPPTAHAERAQVPQSVKKSGASDNWFIENVPLTVSSGTFTCAEKG